MWLWHPYLFVYSILRVLHSSNTIVLKLHPWLFNILRVPQLMVAGWNWDDPKQLYDINIFLLKLKWREELLAKYISPIYHPIQIQTRLEIQLLLVFCQEILDDFSRWLITWLMVSLNLTRSIFFIKIPKIKPPFWFCFYFYLLIRFLILFWVGII